MAGRLDLPLEFGLGLVVTRVLKTGFDPTDQIDHMGGHWIP